MQRMEFIMMRPLGIKLIFIITFLIFASAARSDIVDYNYDDLSRLTGANYSDGTNVQFVYDNLGNRLIKSTETSGFVNNAPGAASPLITSGTEDVSTYYVMLNIICVERSRFAAAFSSSPLQKLPHPKASPHFILKTISLRF